MILDELILENLGTFRGKHSIKLTPPSSGKPVVLIGGLNGAGKTTILEAIHLALYGPLAQPSTRRSGSFDNYLRGLIHRGIPATEGAAVQLTFRAYQHGQERTYRVRRRWQGSGATLNQIVLVAIDGKHDEALTATWSEHVETFLPRGIAGLFFFDGEQIEALADLEQSRQVLGSALAALLGLDLIDRLATDLAVLRRRHRSAAIPDHLRQSVEERKQTATSLRQAEEAAAGVAATARVESERAEKRLHELTERYRTAGGDLLDQRDAAQMRLTMLRQQEDEIDEELRREAADIAPMLQVLGLLEGLTRQAALESDAARDQAVVGVMTGRDQRLLDELRSANAKASVIAAIEQFLSSDLEDRQVSAALPRITGLAHPEIIEPLLGSMLPGLRKRLAALVDRREALRSDRDQAERILVAIPDPESLAPLRKQLDEASREAIHCHASLTQAEDRRDALRQERTRADDAYESALDKSAQATLVADDDRRVVDHVDRVRTTLEALKVSATEGHLQRISSLVLEALQRLLRKTYLVTDVQIDPVTHTVALTGADSRPLEAKDLSAGERQLLAVALLWGLARAAGQPLPMVIDTPLGRLDGSHRSHLLERYFPYASHQVILLSTDTEIDEDAYVALHSRIGRSYRLEFDSGTGATTVEPGYFWE